MTLTSFLAFFAAMVKGFESSDTFRLDVGGWCCEGNIGSSSPPPDSCVDDLLPFI